MMLSKGQFNNKTGYPKLITEILKCREIAKNGPKIIIQTVCKHPSQFTDALLTSALIYHTCCSCKNSVFLRSEGLIATLWCIHAKIHAHSQSAKPTNWWVLHLLHQLQLKVFRFVCQFEYHTIFFAVFALIWK